MMTESNFYRVEFREPVAPDAAYYFGSLSAIYERFTADDIGCNVERLWAVKITPGCPYEGSRCTVSQEIMFHKKSNRGIKNGKKEK